MTMAMARSHIEQVEEDPGDTQAKQFKTLVANEYHYKNKRKQKRTMLERRWRKLEHLCPTGGKVKCYSCCGMVW